jgi:hypothetical protein
VAHLVEALRYKPKVRKFDLLWCHWNFSLTLSFHKQYGLGVDTASNRNEYQEYLLGGGGVKVTVPTVSISGSLNLRNPSGPLLGLYRDCFTFLFFFGCK